MRLHFYIFVDALAFAKRVLYTMVEGAGSQPPRTALRDWSVHGNENAFIAGLLGSALYLAFQTGASAPYP